MAMVVRAHVPLTKTQMFWLLNVPDVYKSSVDVNERASIGSNSPSHSYLLGAGCNGDELDDEFRSPHAADILYKVRLHGIPTALHLFFQPLPDVMLGTHPIAFAAGLSYKRAASRDSGPCFSIPLLGDAETKGIQAYLCQNS
ncbi:hypothetical protein BKA70DRAFT_1219202 [Coprinopsis sp. MPI-PUGE-AT-0042]|nr:hypothetical protein BKA70DRAFT_1219202 [Coprinopsis sp. MPI-PUGE-AT-0042]